MEFGFLNAVMLLGGLAAGLPVLAHLISKRRFEVQMWGAMRFLQLGQRTRRRIRLQDYLLLLVRISLICCVAIAISRPWGSSRIFSVFSPRVRHDVVFVLDSSASMAWQGAAQTPHEQAIQWIHQAVEGMGSGESISLIDVRQSPRRIISPPTVDVARVKTELNRLPAPSGTSNLATGIEDALKILMTTENPARRIVVLTDDQSLAWHLSDEMTWERIADLRKQLSVAPMIDMVVLGPTDKTRQNFSVGRLEFSREMTVPEFPTKVRAKLRQSGGTAPEKRTARLEINGQRVEGQSAEVSLLPNGEATVEFDHVFPVAGEFVVSVVLPEDSLPEDDRSNGVVTISPGLPVLVIDGDIRSDPTRSEAFYLQSVFAASGTKSPWIKASVISADQFNDLKLAGTKAVFLLNVKSLTARQWTALESFVNEGGGLVIAPGDKIDAASWNQRSADKNSGLLPAPFLQIAQAPAEQNIGFDSASLEVPWLKRFRRETGVDLVNARFGKWWTLQAEAATSTVDKTEGGTNQTAGGKPTEALQILARSTAGAPLIVQKKFGQGEVIQLAFPLDADWSTVPAKGDFVPFIYEITFNLTAQHSRRNVDPGMPLMLPLPPNVQTDYRVSGPGIHDVPAMPMQRGRVPYAVFRDTSVPGIYRFTREGDQNLGDSHVFVVDDDQAESELTALSENEWSQLLNDRKLARVSSFDEVLAGSRLEQPRVEFWWMLLLAVLGLLIVEAILTRRMVQGGHRHQEALAEEPAT